MDIQTHNERLQTIGLIKLDPISWNDDTNFWDKYALGKLLGEGNFGQVYALTDRQTGKEFAFAAKVMWPMSPNMSPADFQRELRYLSAEVYTLQAAQGGLNKCSW